MKHCSLFCAGPWPFLLIPLFLLIPVLIFTWHPIEDLVANNVRQQTINKHPWAEVETFNRGREVLLAGEAPDEAAITRVVEEAKLAEGVSSVMFVGDIAVKKAPAVLPPPSIKLFRQRGELVLSGKVRSEENAKDLTETVKTVLKNNSVRSNFEYSSEVGDLQPMRDVILAFSKIDEAGAVNIEEGNLTLTGLVSSPDEKDLIGSIAARQFSGSVINRLEIVAPPCQDTIRALLDGSKINFSSGNAEIGPGNNQLLSKIASAATECEASQFEIVGHTDFTGHQAFNQELSQRRADAVVTKLEDFGLDRNRFTTRGAGSSEPVADNSTAAGRASNRRIEFRVTN